MAIRLAYALVGFVPITLFWRNGRPGLEGWVAAAADVAYVAYVVLVVVGIPLGWLATTWQVDDRGVRIRRGWLFRTELSLSWAELVALDVSQPVLHRLVGCYMVRFGMGGPQSDPVRLDAISAAARDRIVAAARAGRPDLPSEAVGPADPDPTDRRILAEDAAGPDEGPDDGDEIYRIRSRDYLMVSLTYGLFILLVPAVLALLDQVREVVAVPTPDLATVAAWGLPWQLAGAVGVLGLSIAYGWVFAWLRYRDFRVVRGAGVLTTSGGMLSAETRTVPTDRITGIKITQNPLMLLFGYGRVSVLTRDAGDQPMANLLFPVIRLADVPGTLTGELDVRTDLVRASLRPSRTARASLAVGAVVVWLCLLALTYAIRPDWLVLAATAVTLVVALVVNSLWVVLRHQPGRGRCYARRGFWWVSHVDFDDTSVQVVESAQGVVGRISRTWSVGLHYYDGRVRRVRALGCSPGERAALSAIVRPG
jgi:uncharacterized membrane protein YdbT with pleckstrin-like domain